MKIDNKNNLLNGEELSAENLHIKGDAHSNSIIEAIHLQIDGATYKDSIQFTRNAKIGIHKGTLRCHNAHINILDGGEVHATTADIKSAISGTIYAQDITIDKASNNLEIIASNSITINQVDGNHNSFKINYKDVPIINSKIDLIQDDIENLEFSLCEAQKHNLSQVSMIEEKIEEFKNELKTIKNSTNTAKITIKKTIKEENQIIFELNNGEFISFTTQNSTYLPFHLEFKNNEIFLKPINKKLIKNS